MSTATGSWKWGGADSPLKHAEEVWPLGFSLVKLSLDLLVSRTVRELISVVLSPKVCGNLLQRSSETNTSLQHV